MSYSLGAKFISELCATTFAIFIGTSAVANELLPSTKGHGMGYFATGLAFVLAFNASGAWFGGISAEMNPAMFLYLALRGKLQYGWVEFVTGSIATITGGFIGGCLTYVYFAGHFWTIPLPQDMDPVSRLVNGPADALSNDAGRFASAFGDASRPKEEETFKDEVIGFGENIAGGGGGGGGSFRGGSFSSFRGSSRRLDVNDDGSSGGNDINGEDARPSPPARFLTRIGSQRVESQRRLLVEMEQERLSRAASSAHVVGGGNSFYNLPTMETIPEVSASTNSNGTTTATETSDGSSSRSSSRHSSGSRMQWQEEFNIDNNTGADDDLAESGMRNEHQDATANDIADGNSGARKKYVQFNVPALKKKRNNKPQTMSEIRDQAFDAAIRADQAAKLSVFATRPAQYNRPANFFQEMAGTVVLIVGIQMLKLRLGFNPELANKTSAYTEALFVSFFVTAMVLGLGGTTGFAVNPARDLGPRIAHSLMPIPGKGSSEFHYGLVVPVFGPMAGACLSAAIMIGMEELYASGF